MRISCFMLVSAAAFSSCAALAEEAYTTRIEPRPYYGAVVTIEHGVRVYRPVPATRHMIIDPARRDRKRHRPPRAVRPRRADARGAARPLTSPASLL